VGVPFRGVWKECFNSDHSAYGGSGIMNSGMLVTQPVKYQGRDYSLSLTLPPLAAIVLKLEKEDAGFELAEDI
jgi:1,4-alpha-glucan branching enzyme